VVDLVERDADVEVLGPEHRLLVRREGTHGRIASGDLEVRDGHGAEPAGRDPQPDGAARVVLRSGEQHLGHAVQRSSGGLQVVLRHLRIS
jgi:hypothetical protein